MYTTNREKESRAMSMIRPRRGWSVRLFAAAMIAALVGPGPAAAWAHALDAEQAADARREGWFRSLSGAADEEPSNAAPQTSAPPPAVSRAAATAAAILPVPLQPQSLRVHSEHKNFDPWSLFDGNAGTGLSLSSSAPVRFEVALAQPQALAALTLLGPTEGTLTVFRAKASSCARSRG